MHDRRHPLRRDARIRLFRGAAAVWLWGASGLIGLAGHPASAGQPPAFALTVHREDDPAAEAFRAHRSGVTLLVQGHVRRLLADDRSGSRHQCFILATVSGLTLLVAHNIDLAPRLAGLQPGDYLELRGEYVWNPEGGLMHWTHHDPSGRHRPGYIEWGGHRYE